MKFLSFDLPLVGKQLAQAWRGRNLLKLSDVNLKVLRMDHAGTPMGANVHYDEAALVVEGEAEFELDGQVTKLKAGDLIVIPARCMHRVLPGSHGTIFTVHQDNDEWIDGER
jgi:quercetin dioxygenase-like cupin family protein